MTIFLQLLRYGPSLVNLVMRASVFPKAEKNLDEVNSVLAVIQPYHAELLSAFLAPDVAKEFSARVYGYIVWREGGLPGPPPNPPSKPPKMKIRDKTLFSSRQVRYELGISYPTLVNRYQVRRIVATVSAGGAYYWHKDQLKLLGMTDNEWDIYRETLPRIGEE